LDSINVKALAKINIGLDVLGTLPNGYHEVSMIMQTLNLHDDVDLTKTDGGVTMSCNASFLPCDDSNLCVKAAKLLIEEFDLKQGVDIKLTKRIPVAAGMAGGSTDAAAVLFGMNRIFELGLSKEQLMERGVKLGADVPYCIMRGTALAEGIGEKLSALPPMVKCPVLVAKPPISVSTKMVYDNLDAKFDTVKHPDIKKLIADIEAADLKAICADMGNVLEEVTIPLHPVISDIKQAMMDAGAVGSMMSGSGPTVFGIYDNEQKIEDAATFFKIKYPSYRTYISRPMNG